MNKYDQRIRNFLAIARQRPLTQAEYDRFDVAYSLIFRKMRRLEKGLKTVQAGCYYATNGAAQEIPSNSSVVASAQGSEMTRAPAKTRAFDIDETPTSYCGARRVG